MGGHSSSDDSRWVPRGGVDRKGAHTGVDGASIHAAKSCDIREPQSTTLQGRVRAVMVHIRMVYSVGHVVGAPCGVWGT